MTSLRSSMAVVGAVAALYLLTSAPANAQRNNLIDAVESNSLPQVKALLAAGADVNARDGSGMTVLMAAVALNQKGWDEMVDAVLAGRPDVNARGPGGRTALHLAAGYIQVKIVKALIAARANVNAKDDFGETVLESVSFGDDRKATLLALVAAGADVNAKFSGGKTAFMRACETGETALVPALVAAGADVNATDSGGGTAGVTPLMMVLNDLDAVRALLGAKANVNTKAGGFDALQLVYGRDDAMRVLRTVGPEKLTGFTALIMATQNNMLDNVHLLKSAGAR